MRAIAHWWVAMKMKSLEMLLQKVETPSEPKAELEQYHTSAPVAALLLYMALGDGRIDGCRVLDPGCGDGILGIGAAVLGASSVDGFDVDERMVELARRNADALADDCAAAPAFVRASVKDFLVSAAKEERRWDTVVMNPPFGAQVKGADRPFLTLALASADAVYSIHRKGTEDFVRKMAGGAGFDVVQEQTASLPISHMFDFHEKEREHFGVTLFCLVKE